MCRVQKHKYTCSVCGVWIHDYETTEYCEKAKAVAEKSIKEKGYGTPRHCGDHSSENNTVQENRTGFCTGCVN